MLVDALCSSSFTGGKGRLVMSGAGSSSQFDAAEGEVIEIDSGLFSKLLIVASAAGVYRNLMAKYLANQMNLVEQGKTVEELVITNWPLFEEVTRAEARLFAALDRLDDLEQSD
jgi:hypothetical protein